MALGHQDLGSELAFMQRLWLSAPGIRLAGGTDEIMKNIIAERVLGLPGEIRTDRKPLFRRELQHRGGTRSAIPADPKVLHLHAFVSRDRATFFGSLRLMAVTSPLFLCSSHGTRVLQKAHAGQFLRTLP